MKTKIGILLSCVILIFSSYTFASCCASSCGSTVYEEADYTSSCDCTDPNCGPKAYNDCMSENKCCEAFGNIGAR